VLQDYRVLPRFAEACLRFDVRGGCDCDYEGEREDGLGRVEETIGAHTAFLRPYPRPDAARGHPDP